jgi:transcription antitermination factor NusG
MQNLRDKKFPGFRHQRQRSSALRRVIDAVFALTLTSGWLRYGHLLMTNLSSKPESDGAEPARGELMMRPQIDPWLVLRTRSHQEYVVETDLQQRQINAYLPQRSVLRRWKDRRKVVRTPLFPGYIFVQPRLDQFENIRYIRGSCGLIFVGDKPAELPERDLAAITVLVGSGATLAVNPQLIPGRRVEVIAGPFMGIQGELVRIMSGDRLVINAPLLSSSVSVEVDAGNVSPL